MTIIYLHHCTFITVGAECYRLRPSECIWMVPGTINPLDD